MIMMMETVGCSGRSGRDGRAISCTRYRTPVVQSHPGRPGGWRGRSPAAPQAPGSAQASPAREAEPMGSGLPSPEAHVMEHATSAAPEAPSDDRTNSDLSSQRGARFGKDS